MPAPPSLNLINHKNVKINKISFIYIDQKKKNLFSCKNPKIKYLEIMSLEMYASHLILRRYIMKRILTAFIILLSSSQMCSTEPLARTKKIENNSTEEELIESLAEIMSNMTDDEKENTIAFFSLDWKETGTYKLPKSNSTIAIPEGYQLLIGEEAIKGRKLDGETENQNLEAAVYDADLENVILFENFKGGYVSLDDWEDLDSKSLLRSISEKTEEANKERKKNGIAELHVVGWIQEPILDKHTHTVYWAIEGESDEGAIINSVALRLGRNGFEKLVWVTQKESYVPFGGHLDVMLRSHSFEPGYRYGDYKKGDQIASYGIATLVAATVGGKIVKAGGIILLFKKLGGFIFAGIMALFYKCKNIFTNKKEGQDV